MILNNEKTGRWTLEEHNLFLQGLSLYGKIWKKIALHVQTRSVVQIRTHAQKYFLKLQKNNCDLPPIKSYEYLKVGPKDMIKKKCFNNDSNNLLLQSFNQQSKILIRDNYDYSNILLLSNSENHNNINHINIPTTIPTNTSTFSSSSSSSSSDTVESIPSLTSSLSFFSSSHKPSSISSESISSESTYSYLSPSVTYKNDKIHTIHPIISPSVTTKPSNTITTVNSILTLEQHYNSDQNHIQQHDYHDYDWFAQNLKENESPDEITDTSECDSVCIGSFDSTEYERDSSFNGFDFCQIDLFPLLDLAGSDTIH